MGEGAGERGGPKMYVSSRGGIDMSSSLRSLWSSLVLESQQREEGEGNFRRLWEHPQVKLGLKLGFVIAVPSMARLCLWHILHLCF